MSNAGCDLKITKIPISDASHEIKDKLTPLEHALYDGEDFELLFTIAKDKKEEFISAWQQKFNLTCTCIGDITSQSEVINMIDGDGSEILLLGQGYEHFKYNGSM